MIFVSLLYKLCIMKTMILYEEDEALCSVQVVSWLADNRMWLKAVIFSPIALLYGIWSAAKGSVTTMPESCISSTLCFSVLLLKKEYGPYY